MARSGFSISTIVHAALAVTMVVASMGLSTAYAQEAVRPEIGKPLQVANALIKSGKFKDALVKIREVDSVPNKTANETYLIEYTRGSAASSAGENDTTIKSFEAVIASVYPLREKDMMESRKYFPMPPQKQVRRLPSAKLVHELWFPGRPCPC